LQFTSFTQPQSKGLLYLISKNPSQPNGKNENKTFEQKFDFTL
jgi:hypothetical protein